jgi:hypothetical protein
MLRTVTKQGLEFETISNWALAIVGIGGATIIANMDKVQQHTSLCSRRWLFVLALLSGVCGITIKMCAGYIKFNLNVEGTLLRYFWNTKQKQQELNRTAPEKAIGDFDNVIMAPVTRDFLASRPLLFRLIAKRISKRAQSDELYIQKRSAFLTQWIMVLLLLQVLSLAASGVLLGYEFLWRYIK